MYRPKPSAPRPRKKWRPDAESEAIISSPPQPDEMESSEEDWHGELVDSASVYEAEPAYSTEEEALAQEVLQEKTAAKAVVATPTSAPTSVQGQPKRGSARGTKRQRPTARVQPAKARPKRRFARRTAAEKLPPPPAVIPASARAEARELLRPTPVRWGWVVLPVFLVAAAASWFALPIREVTVQGQRHLSAQQVVDAAGIGTDFGWLYYGARRAAGLANEPWVASAVVTRQFPGRVHIAVTERTPYAVWQRPAESGGNIAVARDGTPLPGALVGGSAGLPALEGWGPNRVRDALAALEALRPYNVQLVKFTPSGLTVYPAGGGAAWSGNLDSLLKHANAISEYPNEQLYIYPWGVSVQQ